MKKVSCNQLFSIIGISCSAMIASAQITVASSSENLQLFKIQPNKSNILDVLVLSQRKDWEITKEGTDRTCQHGKFGTFSRHKTTKLWWSKDTAGHGTPPPVWKVFDEKAKGLEWKADADRYGDFIVGKHKGPTGTSIPFSELSCRS